MRTAQITRTGTARKEASGATSGCALLLVAALLAGCTALSARTTVGPPPGDLYAQEHRSPLIARLAAPLARSRQAAAAQLGRIPGPASAAALDVALGDPDPDVAAEAAFALAVLDPPGGAARLAQSTPPSAADAAALGLGSLAGEDVEAAILALLPGSPDPGPALLPGALFSHYRWRGRPAPTLLPSARLLAYEKHATAEGRAGLGHLARAIKDPRLVAALSRLAADADWEVRRAAALGLATSTKTPWPDAARVRSVLATLAEDDVEHVAVAAVRALTSFETPDAVEALLGALGHDSLHVRTAAVEGLARRKATDAVGAIAALVGTDSSVSVRGAACSALAALSPETAAAVAATALSDDAEFVRASACELLGAVTGDGEVAAVERLIALATSDPHVRVRESAVDALGGKSESASSDAIAALLAQVLASDPDPVVVAVACGVVAKDERAALLSLVRAVPERFADRLGADARDAALSCVAALDPAGAGPFLHAGVYDADPSVSWSAQKALATIAGIDPPPPRRSGVTGARDGDLAGVVGDPLLVLETSRGTLRIQLFADVAPLHVARVVAHARAGGYDGMSWHRVVPDFVIQGGCPRGDGSGNAGVTLPLEPTRIPFERGVLGMPRSGHPDSGGCQLFVMHSRAPHLDVHYTAFGRVLAADLGVIDRIDVDDRILRATVATAPPGTTPAREAVGQD